MIVVEMNNYVHSPDNPRWFKNWSSQFVKEFQAHHGRGPDYPDALMAIRQWGCEMYGEKGAMEFEVRFDNDEDFTFFVLKWS